MTDSAPAAPHIRRDANALVCRHCGKTKPIRKKTTKENVASWLRDHERCRRVTK